MLTDEEFAKLERYRTNAFDEWYITRKAAPWGYSLLWNQYYAQAIGRTARKPLMLLVLFAALEKSGRTTVDDSSCEKSVG